jgi:hypothetical protein
MDGSVLEVSRKPPIRDYYPGLSAPKAGEVNGHRVAALMDLDADHLPEGGLGDQPDAVLARLAGLARR